MRIGINYTLRAFTTGDWRGGVRPSSARNRNVNDDTEKTPVAGTRYNDQARASACAKTARRRQAHVRRTGVKEMIIQTTKQCVRTWRASSLLELSGRRRRRRPIKKVCRGQKSHYRVCRAKTVFSFSLPVRTSAGTTTTTRCAAENVRVVHE